MLQRGKVIRISLAACACISGIPDCPRTPPLPIYGKPKKRAAAMADDLLSGTGPDTYDASSIEVLEGLEPVRKRPGMYIGGTDERALHHLVAEVLDNSMDEAVAGHANRIEVELHSDYAITIRDNGRGIPIDPHPNCAPCTQAASSAARPIRPLAVCTASAHPSSTPCPTAWSCKSPATASARHNRHLPRGRRNLRLAPFQTRAPVQIDPLQGVPVLRR